MGLYLCVFDGEDELEGVEVGSYADFGSFRDTVAMTVENGETGSVCPVLNLHSDSDGEWTSSESEELLLELANIEAAFKKSPPVEFNSQWKHEVAVKFGISIRTLHDCFFDIDGESLIERLSGLAKVSVKSGQPIIFQ